MDALKDGFFPSSSRPFSVHDSRAANQPIHGPGHEGMANLPGRNHRRDGRSRFRKTPGRRRHPRYQGIEPLFFLALQDRFPPGQVPFPRRHKAREIALPGDQGPGKTQGLHPPHKIRTGQNAARQECLSPTGAKEIPGLLKGKGTGGDRPRKQFGPAPAIRRVVDQGA